MSADLTPKERLYLEAIEAMGDPVCESDVADYCWPRIKHRGVRLVGNSLERKGRLRFVEHWDDEGYLVQALPPASRAEPEANR